MKDRKEILKEYFDSISDDNVKKFMGQCVEIIPEYWFSVPASSTGKYHPNYALGDGGLVRHTIALLRFFDRLMRNDMYGKPFSERERDLLRVACLMHDSFKSGTEEEYEKSKYTKFNHPILAANAIRAIKTDFISEDEKELIANAIEAHMGQWNTDKKSSETLPLPTNKYQKILHTVDYLAAQKGIELSFEAPKNVLEGTESSMCDMRPVEITADTYVFTFGKHKGETLKQVLDTAPDYIDWLKKNYEKEPLVSLLKDW